MPYHPRIECKKVTTFQTTRTTRSELWFVNNRQLEEAILGYAAKYSKRYDVKLYALAIEGNHIQFPALFPKANRAHFMRDFNSSVARAVPRYQSNYKGGRLWARRYSAEYLPDAEDIEAQFFYTVLQAVQDGLVDNIYQYPGYNCFEDAINERKRSFPVVNWKAYNDAKRWNSNLSPKDFTEYYELSFERLPGYEDLTKDDYIRIMREKLRMHTELAMQTRQGRKSFGQAKLNKVKAGCIPKRTKTSTYSTHRPRILCKDQTRRKDCEAWYFDIYFAYKDASAAYRSGEFNTEFPAGTYRPPMFTIAYKEVI